MCIASYWKSVKQTCLLFYFHSKRNTFTLFIFLSTAPTAMSVTSMSTSSRGVLHDRIILCSVPLPNTAILRLILIYEPLGGTCSNQIQTIATPKPDKTNQAKPKIRTGMSQYSLPPRFQGAEDSNHYQTFKSFGSFCYNVQV